VRILVTGYPRSGTTAVWSILAGSIPGAWGACEPINGTIWTGGFRDTLGRRHSDPDVVRRAFLDHEHVVVKEVWPYAEEFGDLPWDLTVAVLRDPCDAVASAMRVNRWTIHKACHEMHGWAVALDSSTVWNRGWRHVTLERLTDERLLLDQLDVCGSPGWACPMSGWGDARALASTRIVHSVPTRLFPHERDMAWAAAEGETYRHFYGGHHA
jgi:hypothetical protein